MELLSVSINLFMQLHVHIYIVRNPLAFTFLLHMFPAKKADFFASFCCKNLNLVDICSWSPCNFPSPRGFSHNYRSSNPSLTRCWCSWSLDNASQTSSDDLHSEGSRVLGSSPSSYPSRRSWPRRGAPTAWVFGRCCPTDTPPDSPWCSAEKQAHYIEPRGWIEWMSPVSYNAFEVVHILVQVFVVEFLKNNRIHGRFQISDVHHHASSLIYWTANSDLHCSKRRVSGIHYVEWVRLY